MASVCHLSLEELSFSISCVWLADRLKYQAREKLQLYKYSWWWVYWHYFFTCDNCRPPGWIVTLWLHMLLAVAHLASIVLGKQSVSFKIDQAKNNLLKWSRVTRPADMLDFICFIFSTAGSFVIACVFLCTCVLCVVELKVTHPPNLIKWKSIKYNPMELSV